MGKGKRELILKVTLGCLGLLLLGWIFFLTEPAISGQPYNSTALVNTTVNITNAAPLVTSIVIPSSIDLTAYANTTVLCNVTVNDYDNNTMELNATLHYFGVSANGPPDQNNLYQNSSCTRLTPLDFYTNYSCSFNVNYFANNGTWYCNATAIDILNASSNNRSNPGSINPLIAIKMPLLIDYGQLGAEETSNDTLANITNAGNRNINISVEGYGSIQNDGYAMLCDSGSIPINNERYDISSETAYIFMTALTGATTMIPTFSIAQRVSESDDSIGITYWKLRIPSGAGGICNGKILFTANDKGS